MKRFVTSITLLSLIAYFLSGSVYAQYGQYGGPTPNLNIVIDKMVGKPNTNVDYVDNLSPSDPRFAAGQDVFFKLRVKNTSNIILKNVIVTDFLPSYIDPVEGPGTYNASNRTISFNAGDFRPDEEKVYVLKMRVQAQGSLPSDKGLFCVVNKSRAETNQFDSSNLINPTVTPNPNNIAAEDTAQLCIEKQVTQITPGVSQVPSAGPELGLALLGGQMLALGAGIFLKRKTS